MFVNSVGGATINVQPTCISFWRDGIAERKSDRHSSVLGELGRRAEHDRPASQSGGSYVCARVDGTHLSAAARAADQLTRLYRFDMPGWADLASGARPPLRNVEDFEPGGHRTGWQHEAAARVERQHRERNLMLQSSEREQALLRSQSGPAAGMSLSAVPSSFLTRIESQLFRVSLLRRLRLPLPPSSRYCSCGRLSDIFGHHRASCAQAGVLGRRGFAIESAAARICREAGGRVATNRFVRDLDIGVPVNVGRVWKLLWTDSLRTVEPSSPWTPRSCQCCTVMGHHIEAQLMRMGSFWWQPDAGRNEPTLSWSSPGTEPSWSCLLEEELMERRRTSTASCVTGVLPVLTLQREPQVEHEGRACQFVVDAKD